jgi:effector-binding domain-containing protein
MAYEVTLRDTHPQHILSRRLMVATSDLPAAMSETFQRLYAHMAAIGVPPAGAPFAIYWSDPRSEQWDEQWDVELCAPVSREVEAPIGFESRTVSGGLVASTMHIGPYDRVESAYEAVAAWVEQQGYREADAPREVYLSPPETPEDQVRTIIEWPVSPTIVVAHE